MIDINVFANTSASRATVDQFGHSSWLKIECGPSALTIFGGTQHAEALRMMADIFNDAFGPRAEIASAEQPEIAELERILEAEGL